MLRLLTCVKFGKNKKNKKQKATSLEALTVKIASWPPVAPAWRWWHSRHTRRNRLKTLPLGDRTSGDDGWGSAGFAPVNCRGSGPDLLSSPSSHAASPRPPYYHMNGRVSRRPDTGLAAEPLAFGHKRKHLCYREQREGGGGGGNGRRTSGGSIHTTSGQTF